MSSYSLNLSGHLFPLAMASLIKTAAVAVAMRKCPFLSNEVLSFALKSRSLSMFAKKCPVMSKLMTQVGALLVKRC